MPGLREKARFFLRCHLVGVVAFMPTFGFRNCYALYKRFSFRNDLRKLILALYRTICFLILFFLVGEGDVLHVGNILPYGVRNVFSKGAVETEVARLKLLSNA